MEGFEVNDIIYKTETKIVAGSDNRLRTEIKDFNTYFYYPSYLNEEVKEGITTYIKESVKEIFAKKLDDKIETQSFKKIIEKLADQIKNMPKQVLVYDPDNGHHALTREDVENFYDKYQTMVVEIFNANTVAVTTLLEEIKNKEFTLANEEYVQGYVEKLTKKFTDCFTVLVDLSEELVSLMDDRLRHMVKYEESIKTLLEKKRLEIEACNVKPILLTIKSIDVENKTETKVENDSVRYEYLLDEYIGKNRKNEDNEEALKFANARIAEQNKEIEEKAERINSLESLVRVLKGQKEELESQIDYLQKELSKAK